MSARIDLDKIPLNWPTDGMPDEFLAELGRCIATFGTLEEVLLKTIYAISGTQRYEQVTDEMLQKWIELLEGGLRDSLKRLINKLENVLREADEPALEDWPNFIKDLRVANGRRDILCHGSWRPGTKEGYWHPFFINTKLKKYEGEFNCCNLRETQLATVKLIANCVNLVTLSGYKFPGSNTPGKSIE